MSETREPAHIDAPAARRSAAFPLGAARKGLTGLGVAFVAVNLLLVMTGGAGATGPAVAAVLWGAAAMCFLGAFVVYMVEPTNRRDDKDAPPRAASGGKSAGANRETATVKDPSADTARKGETPKDDDGADRFGAGAPKHKADGPDASGSESKKQKDGGSPPLLRPGNPLRLVRGGVTAFVGSLFALLLMSHAGQLRWGVPLGALFVAIASWGVMDLLGTFDDTTDRVARSVTLRQIAPHLAAFVAACILFCAALGGAQAGAALPQVAWGVLVTLTFAASVVALFELGRRLGAWETDENGEPRPLWKRHGFWVVLAAAALYFPLLGTYALWDPWETHYGEVSREMLARDDWVSLWWAQDGWFWSKPVLDMWMQAIAMATLGVNYHPDKMLIGDGTRPLAHPEWAVRTPVVLLTILAMYLLYKGAAKTFGRRAALLGSLVLATMPDWYFIAHQTMTDMPFVAAMTACIGLVLLGLRTPETLELRAYEVRVGPRRWRLTGWHLVFGAVLLCALPQILYLLSRNFEFLWRPNAHGFRPHWDEFRSGSGGGNCGLPGNEDCKSTLPASIPHSTGATPDSFGGIVWRAVGAFEPALQAVVWTLALGVVLYLNWGERRARRLYYLGAWFFAAISTLGKGPAGFLLPILVVLAYLFASRPSEDLFARLQRIVRELTHFEIVGGVVLILLVALPWYVAMYVRHGTPFTDRLIFHDMFNRAFHHVHDTNEGDDTSFRFYLWQLGYALFPWTGLAPVGLLWWLRRGRREGGANDDDPRADTSVLLCLWFIFAFALFSFMGTKFHHYIFPAVPPIAVLIGVVLDDMLGDRPLAQARRLPAYIAGVTAGTALTVFGIARLLPGSFFGTKPGGHLPDASPASGAVLLASGLAMVVVFVAVFRSKDKLAPFGAGAPKDKPGEAPFAAGAPKDKPGEAPETAAAEAGHASRMLAAGAAAGALVLVLVARDLVIKAESSGEQPGAIRLLQLFTYNYKRLWPSDSLDFSAALAGFGAVAVAISLALTVRAVRQHAVVAMCAFAFVWGLWGVDVYMTKTAPHWGQHEVIEAYYADRASPEEILVAYQMNWKGENFYTGNHVPAFVSTGQTFTAWMKKKRDEGTKVMYFITEHGRVGGLKSEVGGKSYREVTDKTLCNKFVVVRAEL